MFLIEHVSVRAPISLQPEKPVISFIAKYNLQELIWTKTERKTTVWVLHTYVEIFYDKSQAQKSVQ